MDIAGRIGPRGLWFLMVLAVWWLNARVEKLEDESDARRRGGR